LNNFQEPAFDTNCKEFKLNSRGEWFELCRIFTKTSVKSEIL